MTEERQNDKVLCYAAFLTVICQAEKSPEKIWRVQRICIYPSYLDSKKSVSEGRRVAAAIGESGSQVSKQSIGMAAYCVCNCIFHLRHVGMTWQCSGC